MELTTKTSEAASEASGGGEVAETSVAPESLGILRDVEIELTLEIGRRRMKIADILRLGPGQTVELQKLAGEPLELLVNGRIIGRGEAVVVGDHYGVRITELVSGEGSSR
jgi:flagellar motor switch protein FliN/FliY